MATTPFPRRKVEQVLVWLMLLLPALSSALEVSPKITEPSPFPSYRVNPKLTGTENLCLIFGTVLGTFSGGGDPGDVYSWIVTNSNGDEIFNKSGGAQLETIQVVFGEAGIYQVQLKVRRGTNEEFYEETLNVTVQQGPEIVLHPDYLLCAGSPTLLVAANPDSQTLSEFTIEWKDIDGNLIGTGNELLAYNEGFYLMEMYRDNPGAQATCVINASTFVGPPVDFQILKSSDSVCENGSIKFELDTPVTGNWFVQKGYGGTKEQIESGYELTIESIDLSGPGLYLVFFQTTSEDFPDCISERMVSFELVESPQITINILNQPDDCSVHNGSFEIIANSDIDTLYIPELNLLEGPISAGETRTFSNLEPQVYTLNFSSSTCKLTNLVILDSDNPPTTPTPPTQLDPSITIQDETCSASGIQNGSVNIDFGTTLTNSFYRILALGQGEILRGTIPANGQLSVNLGDGTYLLELKENGCSYPVKTITVNKASDVSFSVPASMNICETFTLSPETSQNLRFTLTFPDGNTEVINSSSSFTLTEAGAYSIYGEAIDPNSGLCPKRVDFTASLSSTISFAPVLAIEKCFDPIRYEIELEGIAIEDAAIRWFNDIGEIVGRGPEFYPATEGDYSLLVQPLKSGFCPVTPVPFVVKAPVTSVPMELTADKICPMPETATITLTTIEEDVLRTEWIYYDLQDNRTELSAFDGLFEIEIDQVGTYEVVTYNYYGCEIGRSLIAIEASELLTAPELEEEYGICVKGKSGPVLNPGDYSEYYWYLENELVSQDPIFTPIEVGNYTLKVITVDGCEFSDTFTTYDLCLFEYRMPNAMILGDPSRNFAVFLSEGVTEAEVFIYNRQGALIHFQQTTERNPDSGNLVWDGQYQGRYIQQGTYAVVLILKNPLYGYQEMINSSLLVLK